MDRLKRNKLNIIGSGLIILYFVFLLCPKAAHAMRNDSGWIGRVHKRHTFASNEIERKQKPNYLKNRKPLGAPGYVYTTTRGIKYLHAGNAPINIYTIHFRRKLNSYEWEGYYIRLNHVIRNNIKGTVFCVLKNMYMTGIRLEVRSDRVSKERFDEIISKTNKLFNDFPPKHNDWQDKRWKR